MHFILAGSFTLHNTRDRHLTAGEVEIRVLQLPSGRQNLTLPDYVRVVRYPSRIDAERGDHSVQPTLEDLSDFDERFADLSLLNDG